jgi:Amt family ammonium transporter
VAGLVAITPACAFIAPWAAVLLGLVAGACCALAISLKYRLGFDDSLDVVGVHFVGGWIGSLWIGLFGSTAVNSVVANEGLFYGGGATQLGKQAAGSAIVTVYSFAIAWLLGTAIEKTIGFRVSKDAEREGVDLTEHAESGYDLSPASGGGAFAMAGVSPARPGEASGGASAPVTEPVAG